MEEVSFNSGILCRCAKGFGTTIFQLTMYTSMPLSFAMRKRFFQNTFQSSISLSENGLASGYLSSLTIYGKGCMLYKASTLNLFSNIIFKKLSQNFRSRQVLRW